MRQTRIRNGTTAAMSFGLRFLSLIALINLLQLHFFLLPGLYRDRIDIRFLSRLPPADKERLDTTQQVVTTPPKPIPKPIQRKFSEWRASVTFRNRSNTKAAMPRQEGNNHTNTTAAMPQQEGNRISTFGPVNFTMINGTNILFPSDVTNFYCKRRYDRAGAAIQDYLMAHAFAFHFRRQFAGACGPDWYPHNHQAQMDLIKLLGLQEELLILDECPTTNETSAMILDPYLYYMWKDTDVWTPEWIEYMQQQRLIDRQQQESRNQQEPTMAVHIRRGDVHPCDNYTYNRYLPNSHYIGLIDQYRPNNHSKVIVHSEHQSRVEPWTDFDEIDGIELKLDSDIVETWRDILNADVFIMSLSSFSLVPALFSKASMIIYSPFWHRPRPHWIRVSEKMMMQSNSQTALIRQNKCSVIFDSLKQPLKVSQKALHSTLKAVKNTCHPSNCTRW